MTPPADPSDSARALAARELARLTGQVEAMRAVLVRLLQDVVAAEKRLSNSEAEQLLEANEQLVLAAVQNQADAETAAQALDDIARTADLDALTQLPNRMLLLDRFGSAIAGAKRHGTRLGVLFLDIDNFKSINDTFGHAIGDEALKRVARCLTASVRAADTVSRHGGDEFLVLLTEVSHAADAVRVADKVMALLGATAPVGDQVLRVSVSIGISLFPDDGEDPVTLIERADAAMYRAKRHAPGSSVLHGNAPLGERVRLVPARESRRLLDPDPASARRATEFDVATPRTALTLDGDPVRLAERLVKLLDDASKFTPEGSALGLSVAESAGRLEITVADNGIGITPQALPGIFVRMGLTVIKALTEAQGGAVVASSAGPGLGRRFVVTLPPSAAGGSGNE